MGELTHGTNHGMIAEDTIKCMKVKLYSVILQICTNTLAVHATLRPVVFFCLIQQLQYYNFRNFIGWMNE